MALNIPTSSFLDTQIAPRLKAGYDALTSVANVLGATTKNFTFTPDQVRAVETFTLQRLMEGRAEYLGFTITSAMQSANPAIFELFPMIKTNDITFSTDYYEFPKQIAIATPAQAPPSYVKVEKRSHHVTLERYSLAATTTVQELRTAEGQFIFRGKLITVAVGFIDAAELLAIQLLLTRPSFYAQYWIESGQHPFDLARAGRMTDLYFDILRRRENALPELVDLVRQSMSQRNIEPTHIIMSEGMRSIYMQSPKYLEYYRIGAEAANNSRRLTDAAGDSFDGLKFIIISPVDFGEADMIVNPLERLTIIGQHFRMDHFYDDELCDEKWCSKFYSIQFFSMEADGWATITIDDAIENCERFSPADGYLADHHLALRDDLANKVRESGVPVYENQYDMFIYLAFNESNKRPVANVAELWGHMERWALSDITVRRVAATTVAAMRRAFDSLADKYMEAIALGLADIKELYSQQIDDLDAAFLGAAGPLNRTGIRELPAAPAGFAGVTNYRPPGYGSVRGYWEIGEKAGKNGFGYIDQGLASRASAFRTASVQLHAFYKELYGVSHPALDPRNAPADYLLNNGSVLSGRATDAENERASMLNFFQNIVDKPKTTLLISGGAGGAAAAAGRTTPLPEGSPFANINDIAIPFPPRFAARFGSPAAVDQFETDFENSTFARRYAELIGGSRASRRGRRGAPSDDADAAEVFEGSALARFNRREVVQKGLTDDQIIALYTRVIDIVDRNANEEFTLDTLEAWSRDAGGAQLRGRLGADLPAGAVNARTTAFVASLDALRNSAAATGAAPSVFLSAPNNSAAPISLAAATPENDGTGANNNLLLTSIVSSRAAPTRAPVAGVRGVPGGRGRESVDPTESLFGGIGGQPPGYALDAFTDTVGTETVVNKNITGRFAEVAKSTNWAHRIAAQMFLLAPITKHVLRKFNELNIAQPVAWLVQMPFRRYRASSMIFVSKSSVRPFGATRYLDFDTHLGRNAINKDLMVHISGYMGPTAEDVQDWFVAHDTAIVGYEGGENARAIRVSNWNINAVDQQGYEGPSLFYQMVPAGSLIGNDKTPTTHDIRGFADAVNYNGNSLHRDSVWGGRPFYSTALYYNTLFGLSDIVTPTSADWTRFHRRQGTLNTVTHQGYQRVRNTHTGNFDGDYLPSSDPFKDSVGPGVRELRDSALPRVYGKNSYTGQARAF